MKPIEELLQNLARPDVVEFGLVTNRLPSVNVGGKFEPVDQEAPPTDVVLAMLSTMGGARHLDKLGDRPTQWTTRLDGVGVLAVAAIRRGEIVQARFTLVRRESERGLVAAAQAAAPAPPPAQPAKPSQAPAPPAPPPRDSERIAVAPASQTHAGPPPARTGRDAAIPKVRVRSPLASTQQGTEPLPAVSAEGPAEDVPRPMPARRALEIEEIEAPSEPQVAEERAAPPVAAPPPEEPWDGDDDDDEPTVQTASPPVSRGAPSPISKPDAPTEEIPRPKPARRPEIRRSVPPMPAAEPVSDDDTQSLPREELPPREETPPATEAMGPPRITAQVVSAVPSTEPSVPVAAAEPLREVTAEAILGVGAAMRAAIVHVVTDRPLLLRIGGDLVAHGPPLAAEDVEKLARGSLTPASWQRFEQEGACEAVVDVPRFGRVRATLTRHDGGVKITFRGAVREAPSPDALGLPAALLGSVRQPGLVLVSAPSGQGRTTTLAGIVSLLGEKTSGAIAVVEEPLEYTYPKKRALVLQRDVGVTCRSYASGVRAALSQDVDVLVVGDVRDAETLREVVCAVEALSTVVVAVRATSVARAFARLVDMAHAGERARVVRALSGSLTLAVNQRLVSSTDRARRHLASEVLLATPTVRAALREGRLDAALLAPKRPAGYIALEQSLAELVVKGHIDVAAASAATERAAEVAELVAARAKKGAT